MRSKPRCTSSIFSEAAVSGSRRCFITLRRRPPSGRETFTSRGGGLPRRYWSRLAIRLCWPCLPSTSWIDLARLSAVVGTPASEVRLATSEELLAMFPDCEPGVVPPFGRLYGLTTLVDSGLAEVAEIVMGANTRHEGLRMHFCDFQTLEEPFGASLPSPARLQLRTPRSGEIVDPRPVGIVGRLIHFVNVLSKRRHRGVRTLRAASSPIPRACERRRSGLLSARTRAR